MSTGDLWFRCIHCPFSTNHHESFSHHLASNHEDKKGRFVFHVFKEFMKECEHGMNILTCGLCHAVYPGES